MEIRQLQTFLELVRSLSFSKAAEELGYSQSTVTVQIQSLEEEFGIKLFDRVGKKIQLTEKGNEFLPYALRIVSEVEKAELSIRDDEELKGTLRIGTIESICYSKLPNIIHFFQENHPKVHIQVIIDTPSVLIEKMEKNYVDVIYILDEIRYSPKWQRVMEKKEDVVFVTNKECPLSSEHHVDIRELLEYPIYLTEKNANYRKYLDRFLSTRGIRIVPFLEVSDTHFIVKLIQKNNGIALLPYFTIEASLMQDKLCMIHVNDFHTTMYRQIFYHKDKYVTREMAEFIAIARQA